MPFVAEAVKLSSDLGFVLLVAVPEAVTERDDEVRDLGVEGDADGADDGG